MTAARPRPAGGSRLRPSSLSPEPAGRWASALLLPCAAENSPLQRCLPRRLSRREGPSPRCGHYLCLSPAGAGGPPAEPVRRRRGLGGHPVCQAGEDGASAGQRCLWPRCPAARSPQSRSTCGAADRARRGRAPPAAVGSPGVASSFFSLVLVSHCPRCWGRLKGPPACPRRSPRPVAPGCVAGVRVEPERLRGAARAGPRVRGRCRS